MSTFAWLLLGHFVGDWVLQNDWMAREKKTGLLTLAGTIHFLIYTVMVTGALWLSGIRDREPLFYLLFGGLVLLSHWLIDGTDGVGRWMRFFRQSHVEAVRLMVDQTLHLLVLVVLMVVLVGV